MKEIKDLTQGDLFHLANLATGGHFNRPWSTDRKEVEVGGYGKRRRIEWVMDGDEPNNFAGIGSANLNEKGKNAIIKAYEYNFNKNDE